MTIPDLTQPTSTGVGKLNRGERTRQTAGTEAGALLTDLQFVHELDIDDLDLIVAVNEIVPGVDGAVARGTGEDSNGRYVLEWRPAGPCRLRLLTHPGRSDLYRGPAIVQRIVVRVLPTVAVLTVYIRLEALDPDDLPGVLRSLGELVEYEVEWMAEDSAVRTAGPGQGGLFDGVECGPGDIVVFGSNQDAGIVVSVAPGIGPIVRRTLIDTANTIPEQVPAQQVLQAVRICGPRGGPADDVLRRIATVVAPDATPALLLAALTEAQSSGTTELIEGSGWALTSSVIAMTARLADNGTAEDPDAAPGPQGAQDDEDVPDPV